MHDTLAFESSGILAEMPPAKIQYQAYSKINLSLSVGLPNSAGMHPIVSKMACIDLCDDLEVTRLDVGDLSRYAIIWHEDARQKSPIDWSITTDLAVRAHRLLESMVGYSLPVQLKLQKRIPVGGGLGGGSSDAAAMLCSIAKLFELDIDLVAAGATLGSDIPFFLTGGSAIVSGFGEQIESINEDTQHLVLVIPQYGCSTIAVYDAFDKIGDGVLQKERVHAGDLFNDLFHAACQISPDLGKDRSTIGAIAKEEIHLSGSGSTMFVICDNALHAETLARSIEEQTNLVAIATHTCLAVDVIIEEKT